MSLLAANQFLTLIAQRQLLTAIFSQHFQYTRQQFENEKKETYHKQQILKDELPNSPNMFIRNVWRLERRI